MAELRRRGSLLIITLWIITILSVVAVALARALSVEVRLTKYRLAHEQAVALARSGVYLAMQRLNQDSPPAGEAFDWLGDDWAAFAQADPAADPATWTVALGAPIADPAAGAEAQIAITDEERRLNLNAATEPALTALLLPHGGTQELSQAILDYRDPDAEPVTGEPPSYPKNAPLVALEELRDVPGMSAALFEALRPLAAAVPESGAVPRVNINTAERDVLLALGGDPAVVDALVGRRAGGDGILGTDDDCKAVAFAQAAADLSACALAGDPTPVAQLLSLPTATFAVASSVFRVSVQAHVTQPSAARHEIEAVIQRGSGPPAAIQILSWRER